MSETSWFFAIAMFVYAWYQFTKKDNRIAELEKENKRLNDWVDVLRGKITDYLNKPIAPYSAREALGELTTWEPRVRP